VQQQGGDDAGSSGSGKQAVSEPPAAQPVRLKRCSSGSQPAGNKRLKPQPAACPQVDVPAVQVNGSSSGVDRPAVSQPQSTAVDAQPADDGSSSSGGDKAAKSQPVAQQAVGSSSSGGSDKPACREQPAKQQPEVVGNDWC
jgi:hypothetical protein